MAKIQTQREKDGNYTWVASSEETHLKECGGLAMYFYE